MEKCKTCYGEGGITVENFNDPESFECPDCGGTGEQRVAKMKYHHEYFDTQHGEQASPKED